MNMTERWTQALRPQINTPIIPTSTVRAMKAALKSVDQDITQHGAVSEQTVERVRAALDLIKKS